MSQVWAKDDNEKVNREILMTTEQLNDWKTIINTLEAVGTGIDGRSEAPSIITKRLADALGIEIDESRSERNPNKTITLVN